MADWTLDKYLKHLDVEASGRFHERVLARFSKAAGALEREAKLIATSRMKQRTGKLRNSIAATVHEDTAGLYIRLATKRRYGRIQELGGTVRPRRGKYLAIPLPGALTATGALKGEFDRPSLRMVPGLFVVRGKSGKLLLARKKANGGLQFLFVLHRGPITIRAKHYLRDAVRETAKRFPREVVSDVVAAAGGGSSQGGP